MRINNKGLTPIGQILSPKLLRTIKGPSVIQKRLIDGAAFHIENPDKQQNFLFQHTVYAKRVYPSAILATRREHGNDSMGMFI